MTTPNIEELIDRLRDPQTRGTTGEWFDRAVAADALQSQAERIKELESECEVERLRLAACGVAALGYFDGCKDEYKSASLDDVLRLNKRCTDLRAELGDLPEAQAEMLTEIKQLRAEIAAIAATEPVAWFFTDIQSGGQEADTDPDSYTREVATGYKRKQPLFTHPMPAQDVVPLSEYKKLQALVTSQGIRLMDYESEPAQDVTELVDALADLQRQYAEHPDAFWDWSKARTALSKYKGAK